MYSDGLSRGALVETSITCRKVQSRGDEVERHAIRPRPGGRWGRRRGVDGTAEALDEPAVTAMLGEQKDQLGVSLRMKQRRCECVAPCFLLSYTKLLSRSTQAFATYSAVYVMLAACILKIPP